jgi:hypothetical protein
VTPSFGRLRGHGDKLGSSEERHNVVNQLSCKRFLFGISEFEPILSGLLIHWLSTSLHCPVETCRTRNKKEEAGKRRISPLPNSADLQ